MPQQKDSNKTVKVLDQQIDAMRTGVISTIKNIRDNAKIAFGELSKVSGNVSSRLLSLSENERQFLDLTRNREIQNSLYLFLVERRESNLLKVGANAPVGRVIDCAYRDTKPIKPKVLICHGSCTICNAGIPYYMVYFQNHIYKDHSSEIRCYTLL